jgi:superfamily I DNA and/or RNA helicase
MWGGRNVGGALLGFFLKKNLKSFNIRFRDIEKFSYFFWQFSKFNWIFILKNRLIFIIIIFGGCKKIIGWELEIWC